MIDPRMQAGSNMPSYHWMEKKDTDLKTLPKRIAVQRMLGVPYPAMRADEIRQKALDQATEISNDLKQEGAYVAPEKQIIAVIAYLQKLGEFETLDNTGAVVPLPEMKPGVPDAHRATPETLNP